MIAMEYVVGRSLKRIMEREGAIRPERVAAIGRQIASGVAAAHGHGIVHGDLKPENVMVTEEDLVKILDFGLARRENRAPEAEETAVFGVAEADQGVFGTPSYMAPEQTRGEPATPASDVFSLGVILHEMLTGLRTFPGENVLQVLNRIRAVDPERLAAQVDEPFASLLRRALIADPSARQIEMREIAEGLAGTGSSHHELQVV